MSDFHTDYFFIQGSCARTTTAVGPNPAWNQQLTLSFKSPNNDFSADTLSRVKDSLHLHLFDEVFRNFYDSLSLIL